MITALYKAAKQGRSSELLANTPVAIVPDSIFRLDFAWNGPVPQAGQFFLIKPERSSVFLARPFSVMGWDRLACSAVSGTMASDTNGLANDAVSETIVLHFLIARRGTGTAELAQLRAGERAWLTGPLGNSWWDNGSAKADTPIALIGGGIGIAPLAAFARELDKRGRRVYDFYAGFKSASFGLEYLYPRRLYVATEDGCEGRCGRIPDLLLPQNYKAVYACGPMPMLKGVVALCKAAAVPCFVSMEQRMACGVGACLGCTVKVHGNGGSQNRRCCTDGPVFNAEELVFAQ
ncbi:MAG: dihydroorotate dehydrogenase electron transfer subunit [Treponema sp.]|jgi:NAD(P)H-flavin reductase|nr:dihydroorotate dehydrogenase electron transfer subunit [Treponema sp.]